MVPALLKAHPDRERTVQAFVVRPRSADRARVLPVVTLLKVDDAVGSAFVATAALGTERGPVQV